MIAFRLQVTLAAVLAGCFVSALWAADRLTAPPRLKERQLQRGDVIAIEVDSASPPAKTPLIELTRGGQTLYLLSLPPAPLAGTKTLVISAAIPRDIPFGSYDANLYWETARYPLPGIAIQPAGNPAVHLKEPTPAYTYDLQTAYIPDPSDRTAEKVAVSDYAVPIDRSRLPDLSVKWRERMFRPMFNDCVYVPPPGSDNNPVAAPIRFYAREDKNGSIELCSIPTDAKVELAGADAGAKQIGKTSDVWLDKPKRSIDQNVVSVVLHGSGFQVANPRDNAVWINGTRQDGIVWDTCSNTVVLGAGNAPQPLAIHGEAINSEELRLCAVPVPRNGQIRLAVGYGDTQSETVVMRAFGMGRAGVATRAIIIALLLAVLPLALLSTVKRAYRIGNKDYKWRMLFLDPETDTYSLSKLQFYLWTVAALFAYAYLFLSRVRVQFETWPDIPSTLPGIIAVAGGTAVTAQIVTSSVGSKGSGDEHPSFADFITSGGVVAADRLQMFLWTLFGVGAFLYAVWQLEPGTISDLPAIPDRLLVLMGISSAGYLGGKMARKAGPVIDEISINPPEPDERIRKAAAQAPQIPDFVQATVAAQARLAALNLPATANANARAAVDAFAQAVKSAGAAHTSADMNQLVVDLAARRAAAEAAASNAASDFVNGKATQAEAEAAQAAAAGLQDFSADVVQAISMASAAPMNDEVSPVQIARSIDIRGSNLSPDAMFQIDHEDLPFRMLFDKDGHNAPEILAREDATPTLARVLHLSLDPARLASTDQAQIAKWFGADGHHTLTITSPDGQKAQLGFDLPPGTGQKAGS